MRVHSRVAFRIGSIVLVVAFVYAPFGVYAAPVYDQTLGTYVDGFSDATGLVATSSATVSTTAQAVQLLNGSNGFTAPYVTTGTVTTQTILPTLLAQWGTLTVVVNQPTSTLVRARLYDESSTLFSDTLVPGNSAGFSSASVGTTTITVPLSALNPTRTANTLGSAKWGRLRIGFTLTTSNTSSTPLIDSMQLTWTTLLGSVTTSTLAATAWSTSNGADVRGQNLLTHTTSTGWVPRWVRTRSENAGGNVGAAIRGMGSTLANFDGGHFSDGTYTTVTDSVLYGLDRDTGTVNWQRVMSGTSFHNTNLSLAADGTLYNHDIFTDHLTAFDSATGAIKWSYSFGNGHGSNATIVGSNGLVYLTRDGAGGDDTIQLYAFRPDGTVAWTTTVDPPGTTGQPTALVISPTTGVVYLSNSDNSNAGALYAFNGTTGTLLWSVATGDVTAPVLGNDGTIYVANNKSTSVPKSVWAYNPDGTLKWQYALSTSTNRWASLAVLGNGNIAALRQNTTYPTHGGLIEIFNATSGVRVASTSISSESALLNMPFLADRGNGIVLSDFRFTSDASLQHYDDSLALTWQYAPPGQRAQLVIGDESSRLYAELYQETDFDPAQNKFVAFSPWELTDLTGANNVRRGGTITFTVKTTMQATDPVTGAANKLQIRLADSSLITLTLSETLSTSETIWRATQSVPTTASLGSSSYTIEASAAYTQTPTVTHFVTPATGSGNTGLTLAGTYTISSEGGTTGSYNNGYAPTTTTLSTTTPVTPATTSSSIPSSTLSVTDVASDAPLSCPSYLQKYIRRGASNDVAQVRKLQQFLTMYEGFSVPNTGIYGTITEAAVRAFQQRYAAAVVTPWGLPGPTGYVYKTTKRAINVLYCQYQAEHRVPGSGGRLVPPSYDFVR